MTKKHFPFPPMCDDIVRGADLVGERTGKTAKRVYYEWEKLVTGIPYYREGSMICLSMSQYEAHRFAQVRKRAKWDDEEVAWVRMHLAVNKAVALDEQLAERGTPVETLPPDEIACYAEVMAEAVAATTKVIGLLKAQRLQLSGIAHAPASL